MKAYFEDKRIWITGASSGIGESLAKKLSALGARVIISSHEPHELERTKKEAGNTKHEIKIVSFDLSNAGEVGKAADTVLMNEGGIDILFNNGGISTRTTAMDTSLEIDRKIMEINYFAGLILSKKCLPGMIERGFGHIIATSSISGKFGFPLRSAYAASKHALHGFYESLWMENYEKGIRTTVVCPGRVKTNISMHALDKDGKAYGKMSAGQDGGISPDKCAGQILRAVKRNKREALVGGKELIMPKIKQYFPWLFYKLIIKIDPS
ncbi:MAG: SDR family oxidoreductase [Bacteroidales bacterium]|nr:SDR family oxidoreductase [Bacteroidales bacterium]MCF8390333.1 SDR family oxidoreductase [Bacteroidales bacterium]